MYRDSWGQGTYYMGVSEDDAWFHGIDTPVGVALDPDAKYVPFSSLTMPFEELEEALEEFSDATYPQ